MSQEAPACRAALTEATHLWPRRNKAADGILPSAAHHLANPTSDHEKGDAYDLTQDPAHGVSCDALADLVRRDARTKYVIWNRRIWSKARAAEGWRPYHGTDPHIGHMHVSIFHEKRDDTSPWFIRAPARPVSPEFAEVDVAALPVLHKGMSGTHVRLAQGLLVARGKLHESDIDAQFGDRTAKALTEAVGVAYLDARGWTRLLAIKQ